MKKWIVFAVVVLFVVPAVFAADGAATFKAKCAMCHGADGKGQTPIGKSKNLKDLGSPEVQKLTDAQLTDITTNGKGGMPAYKGKLSTEEIAAVVAHLRTFKH